MKKPIDSKHWYFVDETGDPVFYDRHGNLIVGQEGCSPILELGFIESDNPNLLRKALAELHNQIAEDKYLQSIPSINKTNRAFHAKDDAPEIRYLVYQLLAKLEYKVQFVVARKIENVFQKKFRSRETEFYDYLISHLFQNVLHRYSYNHIYFANRGNRERQVPLEQAIRAGVNRFEERWKTKVETSILIEPQTPVGEPCLQIIDYLNWAVYRAFTKQEMRYYKVIESKVSLLIDLYDTEKCPRNWYNQKNPFDINKTSPL